MFRVTTLTAALAISLVSTSSAFADDKEGVYATIGGTILSTELDLSDVEIADQIVDLGEEDANVTMINGRLGYRLNDFFAVEGEVGFGVSDESFNRSVPVTVLGSDLDIDTNVDLKVKNYYIAFARGIIPVSEQFDFFGRIGYGQASAKANATASVEGLTASGSRSDNASGFAYGIGGQYNLSGVDGIRADYTRLDDTNIISLAYSRSF